MQNQLPAAESLKCLMLDLGGVLYAIDVERSYQAFKALSDHPQKIPPLHNLLAHPLFRAFEVGGISREDFRNGLREAFRLSGTDMALDSAWNSLLLGPIPGRVELLQKLAGRYQLILVSNTNALHHDQFMPECKDLFSPFSSLLFSFEAGTRKPDEEIFQLALLQARVSPQECLFVDDSPENLNGGKNLGLHTYHLPQNADISELSRHLLN